MVSTQELLSVLASSNAKKREIFQNAWNTTMDVGVNRDLTVPLFDEEEIKNEVEALHTRNGFDYVASISRKKCEQQRQHLIASEGVGTDYTIFVSDSMAMLGDQIYNRDGLTDDEKEEAISRINKEHKVTYIGAVSFARKLGKSLFTVLTYFDAELDKDITEFPIQIDKLDEYSRSYQVGYIQCGVGEDNKIKYKRIPVKSNVSTLSSEVRPYISGLTPDVLGFGEKSMRFDRDVSSSIEEMITDHPFNNVDYYTQFDGDERDLGALNAYYADIVKNRKQYFHDQGGTCALFSLEMLDLLEQKGFLGKIIIYPSARPLHSRGHSGVLAMTVEGSRYYFDPGLTIPFPIPVSSDIPLFYFAAGTDGKDILFNVVDMNGDKIPDIHMVRGGVVENVENIDQCVPFIAHSCVSGREFEALLPEILVEFHSLRKYVKSDFHKKDGSRNIGFLYKRHSNICTVKLGGQQPIEGLSLDEAIEYFENMASQGSREALHLSGQLKALKISENK